MDALSYYLYWVWIALRFAVAIGIFIIFGMHYDGLSATAVDQWALLLGGFAWLALGVRSLLKFYQ